MAENTDSLSDARRLAGDVLTSQDATGRVDSQPLIRSGQQVRRPELDVQNHARTMLRQNASGILQLGQDIDKTNADPQLTTAQKQQRVLELTEKVHEQSVKLQTGLEQVKSQTPGTPNPNLTALTQRATQTNQGLQEHITQQRTPPQPARIIPQPETNSPQQSPQEQARIAQQQELHRRFPNLHDDISVNGPATVTSTPRNGEGPLFPRYDQHTITVKGTNGSPDYKITESATPVSTFDKDGKVTGHRYEYQTQIEAKQLPAGTVESLEKAGFKVKPVTENGVTEIRLTGKLPEVTNALSNGRVMPAETAEHIRKTWDKANGANAVGLDSQVMKQNAQDAQARRQSGQQSQETPQQQQQLKTDSSGQQQSQQKQLEQQQKLQAQQQEQIRQQQLMQQQTDAQNKNPGNTGKPVASVAPVEEKAAPKPVAAESAPPVVKDNKPVANEPTPKTITTPPGAAPVIDKTTPKAEPKAPSANPENPPEKAPPTAKTNLPPTPEIAEKPAAKAPVTGGGFFHNLNKANAAAGAAETAVDLAHGNYTGASFHAGQSALGIAAELAPRANIALGAGGAALSGAYEGYTTYQQTGDAKKAASAAGIGALKTAAIGGAMAAAPTVVGTTVGVTTVAITGDLAAGAAAGTAAAAGTGVAVAAVATVGTVTAVGAASFGATYAATDHVLNSETSQKYFADHNSELDQLGGRFDFEHHQRTDLGAYKQLTAAAASNGVGNPDKLSDNPRYASLGVKAGQEPENLQRMIDKKEADFNNRSMFQKANDYFDADKNGVDTSQRTQAQIDGAKDELRVYRQSLDNLEKKQQAAQATPAPSAPGASAAPQNSPAPQVGGQASAGPTNPTTSIAPQPTTAAPDPKNIAQATPAPSTAAPPASNLSAPSTTPAPQPEASRPAVAPVQPDKPQASPAAQVSTAPKAPIIAPEAKAPAPSQPAATNTPQASAAPPAPTPATATQATDLNKPAAPAGLTPAGPTPAPVASTLDKAADKPKPTPAPTPAPTDHPALAALKAAREKDPKAKIGLPDGTYASNKHYDAGVPEGGSPSVSSQRQSSGRAV